jgi:GT2 family glycosyltransferase
MNKTAKISVIIASVNRSEQLHLTIESILKQRYQPNEIIISVPDLAHVSPATREMCGVRVVLGSRGSCQQRNAALNSVLSDSDYVFFFDDDIELCASYIAVTVALMQRHPTLAVVLGTLIVDGANGQRVSREQAIECCRAAEGSMAGSDEVKFASRPYGSACSMAVRWSWARTERFDENLPLYGWLEDLDYSYRLRQFGEVVICHNASAVHLGWRGGRVSGRKLGYSQIVNPLYLWRKNRCLPLLTIVYRHWFWHVVANIAGSVLQDSDVDRKGRLIGNVIALRDVIRGSAHPRLVLSERL